MSVCPGRVRVDRLVVSLGVSLALVAYAETSASALSKCYGDPIACCNWVNADSSISDKRIEFGGHVIDCGEIIEIDDPYDPCDDYTSCIPDGDLGDGWPEVPGGGGGGAGGGGGERPSDCPAPKVPVGPVCVCPDGMASDGSGGCREASCTQKHARCRDEARNERVFCRQANWVQALSNCQDGLNPDGSHVPDTRNRDWCGFEGTAFAYCMFQWLSGIPICTEGSTEITVNVGVFGIGKTPGSVEQPFDPYVGTNARCEQEYREGTRQCARGFVACTGTPVDSADAHAHEAVK